LASIWSCHRQMDATPASSSQFPSNIIVIPRASQEAAGFALTKVHARRSRLQPRRWVV
jgi:hypothetical protein